MTPTPESGPHSSGTRHGSGTSILIIDADSAALGQLRRRLQADGHAVLAATTPEEGLVLCRTGNPNLILLDPALPSAHGFDLCVAVRAETDAPIIVMTFSNEEADKIVAFELGADDYVTKPYQLGELIARIRSLLRRTRSVSPKRQRVVVVRNLKLDLGRRELSRSGRRVELRPREYELLVFLIENRGQTFSRAQLLSRIWGYHGQAYRRRAHRTAAPEDRR